MTPQHRPEPGAWLVPCPVCMARADSACWGHEPHHPERTYRRLTMHRERERLWRLVKDQPLVMGALRPTTDGD